MFGEQITRRRNEQTGTDRYGNPIVEAVDTVLPETAAFAPKGSTVSMEVGREAVLTRDALLFYMQWPDLTDADKVVVRGRVRTIEGRPADYRNPWAPEHGGLVVELKDAEG